MNEPVDDCVTANCKVCGEDYQHPLTTAKNYQEGYLCPDCLNRKRNKGCKSVNCQMCQHYVKFLGVSTMQMICWNKKVFFKDKD